MKNLVKCSHCHKLFSDEEFDSHKCDLPLKDVVDIPVSSFFKCSKNMVGIGLDGKRYWFIVKKREAILYPSDEDLQHLLSDKDLTESAISH